MNRYRFVFVGALIALAMLAAPVDLNAAITIISGNGQINVPPPLAPQYFPFFQPLVVRVTDANGVPQPNVQVNWAIVSGGFGGILQVGSATTTDGNGLATNTLQYTAPVSGFGQPVIPTTITATTSDASVTFIETITVAGQGNPGQGLGIQPVTVTPFPFLQDILAGNVLLGQSGTSGSAPIVIHIQDSTGFPVPNVSVQLVSMQDPSSGPVVVCRESQGGSNMVLTDAAGNGACTPQFGGAPGRGTFYVLMGGGGARPADPALPPGLAIRLRDVNLEVTAATPASIRITQGNNQTVNPSQPLPVPLQVEVDGATGNPISGQQIRWVASPANVVNIGTPVTTTDVTGRSSLTLQVQGNASGNITVTATVLSNTSLSSTFNITVVPLVTITGFTLVSGNNQSATIGSAFAQPLVVQVTASSGTAANVPVQFITSGAVSLSATNVSTDSNGRAQVTATAGSVTGPASVTASLTTSTGVGSQTFNLTVLPQAPTITASNFINGADYQPQSLSPCSIGALVAAPGALGVANASPTFPGLPLANPTARLTINNVGAPILSIGNLPNGQQAITFQVPCETAPGSAVPSTLNLGGASTNVNLNIQAASPGIFQTAMSDGVVRAVVVRPDGSFATLTNPARRGENVSIFVTGMGATLPVVGTASVPTPGTAANVQGTVVLGMAGSGVAVVSAKLTEDLPGVFLVTFTIPSDMQTGSNVTLSVAVIPTGSNAPVYSAPNRIPVQ